jgi:hypothetical protein
MNVPRQEIACHEAGHGVIAYRQGSYLGRITIAPDRRDDAAGR